MQGFKMHKYMLKGMLELSWSFAHFKISKDLPGMFIFMPFPSRKVRAEQQIANTVSVCGDN